MRFVKPVAGSAQEIRLIMQTIADSAIVSHRYSETGKEKERKRDGKIVGIRQIDQQMFGSKNGR